jgi:hypothetical protein
MRGAIVTTRKSVNSSSMRSPLEDCVCTGTMPMGSGMMTFLDFVFE